MRRSVLLDSNLAVLFFVGLTGRGRIARHKRLQGYTDRDFAILAAAVEQSRELVVMAQVLTEVSNLIRQSPDTDWSDVADVMVSVVQRSREIAVSSSAAVGVPAFAWLGFADASILAALDENTALITTDEKLFVEAWRIGKHAVFFDALRNG